MNPRLRRLLPALALAAVTVLAATAVLLGALVGSGSESAAAATAKRPQTKRRVHKRPALPTRAERAARIALKAVGVPYRWGGMSPASGFDCSGLVRWAYEHVGIELPHNSYALFGEGRPVRRARLKAGDVLFFEGLGHVGLYLGHGRMVHAPQSGRLVEIVRLAGSNYGRRLIGARRVVTA